MRRKMRENEGKELGSRRDILGLLAGYESRLWASQLDPSGRNPSRMTSKEKTHEAQS